jgi:cyclopropane fatty-acyl-phospholipid synthase-like methyltransferase
MNKFDKIYKEFKNVYGEKISPIIQIAVDNLNIEGDVLDLGCGQGRDALFLGKTGYNVRAVDFSKEAINFVTAKAEELSIKNVEAICSDIRTFEIEQNRYSIIYSINAIPFIGRSDSLALIEKMKTAIKVGGIVAISAMTEDDGSFSSANLQENSTYFKKEELKNLFREFELIKYFEIIKNEDAHPGVSLPHTHGMVRIVVRKIK